MSNDLDIEIEKITQTRGILLTPQINLKFKIKSKLHDDDIKLEPLKYGLAISIPDWLPSLGTGFVFNKEEIIQPEKALLLESSFDLEYGKIMAINNKILNRYDVTFKIAILSRYLKNYEYYNIGSEIEYKIPHSTWRTWYNGWMEDLDRLKKLIGEEIISTSATKIGLAFADRFKQDLETFLTSELTSMRQILERLSKIQELIDISKNKIGSFINEDWALAVLSLSLLENIINLKLEELGAEPGGKVEKRISRLVDKMAKTKQKDISPLGIKMQGKYTERSKVLHSSHKYKIDKDLADEYLQFIKEVIDSLWD